MELKDLKTMIITAIEGTNKYRALDKPVILTEANFNRAKTKIEVDHVPFTMLSGFRADFSKSRNEERNKEIKMTLQLEGFPWVEMKGSGYKEGGPEAEAVIEDSVLVWDEDRGDKYWRTSTSLFELTRALAKEFQQDSFIYGGPDFSLKQPGDYIIRLYSSDGTSIKDIWAGGEEGYSKLDVVDLATSEYWSMLANKAVQFKEMYDRWKDFRPKSRLEAMKKQHYLKLSENKIKEINERKSKYSQ